MTGLVERLREWLGSLTSSTDADGSQQPAEVDGHSTDDATPDSQSATDAATDDAGAATASDDRPAYACSVCGTPVENPDEGCPLCRSTDVVPREPNGSDVADRVEEADGAATEVGDTAQTSPADLEDTDADTEDAENVEDTEDADAEETPTEALSASKVTEVRTGEVDDDAVSRLRALREGDDTSADGENES